MLVPASVLLLATATSAAPYTSNRQKQCDGRRLSALRASTHRTSTPLAVNATGYDEKIEIGKSTETEYSSNWAGAVQIGSGITEVTGQVTFPKIAAPANAASDQTYGGSAWIGIDGDTCPQSILQTGIDWVVQGNQATYAAWYEWLPDASYDFDIVVNPGDTITMKVVADSMTGGTATIINESTNETVTHNFQGQNQLCQVNAEWIVEDFSVGDSNGNSGLIPFAAFDKVVIGNASYVTNGKTAGVEGATIMDIAQNGSPLTDCKTSGDSSVVCSYTGGSSESRVGYDSEATVIHLGYD